MPLTKTTHRKNKCPMCPFKTVDFEELKTHISECGLRQIEKRLHCEECNYNTNKNANLVRNKKRHSQESQSQVNSEPEKCAASPLSPLEADSIIGNVSEDSDVKDSSSDESEKEDRSGRDEKSQQEMKRQNDVKFSELEVGRTIRKPREPTPVQVPKKKAGDERFQSTLKKTIKAVNRFLPRPKIPRPSQMVDEVFKLGKPEIERVLVPVAPQMTSKVHVGVQTTLTKRKVVWTTARWKERDRDIERVEMIEELLD